MIIDTGYSNNNHSSNIHFDGSDGNGDDNKLDLGDEASMTRKASTPESVRFMDESSVADSPISCLHSHTSVFYPLSSRRSRSMSQGSSDGGLNSPISTLIPDDVFKLDHDIIGVRDSVSLHSSTTEPYPPHNKQTRKPPSTSNRRKMFHGMRKMNINQVQLRIMTEQYYLLP